MKTGKGSGLFGTFCLIITLVVLFFYNCAMADEVILVNGDRLSGRIVSITDGILTLETSYSEPVKLKFEAVDRMSSSEPVEIHLSDGEILKGKITGEVHRKIAVKAGVNREQVTVGFDSITALNPPPQKPVTWKGDITLGGNWQDGNSDTLSISAGGLATRRTEKDRFRINVLYNQAKNDGQRTAENTYGQLKYDYFLNPKWYLYLNVDMLSDQFKDINLRTTIGPGAGYQVWEEEGRTLSLEAGVSYTSENRDIGEDKDWVTARLGVDFLYRLFDSIVFTDQFVIYPNLDEVGEYTLRNDAALVTDIWAGWALRLNNIWERNSDPGSDLKKDDFTWIAGLQYSF